VRALIINADGYGFTDGISRAIEECIALGTVRSISANVNFHGSEALRGLVARHPDLSVGCHLNPVVGRPLLSPEQVPSLVDDEGLFWYRQFKRRFQRGAIRLPELRTELLAQIERTRSLAGGNFTHVDFHMGLHRLPRLYPLFLEVAAASGTGRMRTHRYLAGMESRRPRLRRTLYMFERLDRIPKYAWNLHLRWRALRRGFVMPDYWLSISNMGRPGTITLANYVRLLENLPDGVSEFVAHPAHVDDDLRRWSTYLAPRESERQVLTDPAFRDALERSGVRLIGYRDLPVPGPEATAAREVRA
jgi:predicted glycoside hydrolase/deacetylase ChbG (UPF0249 family)